MTTSGDVVPRVSQCERSPATVTTDRYFGGGFPEACHTGNSQSLRLKMISSLSFMIKPSRACLNTFVSCCGFKSFILLGETGSQLSFHNLIKL